MHGPARNRLHAYEAGWLTLLVSMGVASQADAEAAMARVAQAAIEAAGRRERRRNDQRERR
ncbi:MAG: hypothetical protein ACKO4T_06875, partial [Planctomycetaceae bacterium]